MSSQPTKPTHPLLPLPLPRQARPPVPEQAKRVEGRITIRQLSQLPVINLASLDPMKRKAEEARRKALLAQAAQVSERRET